MINLIGEIERQEIIQVGMTSELAKEYLEKYANLEAQRPIKTPRVNGHLFNIQNGLFMSSQIVIGHYYENEDHRTTPQASILDGHHRLHAIVKADTQTELNVEVLKVYAPKETIRQLYGFFDSKKSARDLQALLRWKTVYHEDLKNRWSIENLVPLATSLQYASGHWFTNAGCPGNCLPKGVTINKDDFLSDALDTNRWWFAFDSLDEFINNLSDRPNYGAIKQSLGNVVYGVFLKTLESLSDRGRRGESYNKTMDFWKAVVDGICDYGTGYSNTTGIIKSLMKVQDFIKLTEKRMTGGKGGMPTPMFYAFNKAYEKWMDGKNSLGLNTKTAIQKNAKHVLKDFFAKGEAIKDIHPYFKQNKYWEKGGVEEDNRLF